MFKTKRIDMSKKKKVDEVKEDIVTTEVKIETEPTAEDRVITLEAEVHEWKDKYLRSMAEFENYRRRSIQEKSDWIKLSTEKLAMSVCDVLDNFERALMQLKEDHKGDSVVKGFIMIEQQLRQVLDKEGVKKIECLGKDFDPVYHEALAHIPSELEENMVAAVIQNGYTMHDKVIRPARVAVSNGNLPEKHN
jgi:molecular chaperone GrpE